MSQQQLLYKIFTEDTPLMDVRAPIEFFEGAFPMASNHPLLDDQQRHEIGKRYKDLGQDEAIKLGLELATEELKNRRLEDWKIFINNNPTAFLYCFRGGLRSRTTQQWLKQQGIKIALIKGGYKAMRRYLLDQIEEKTDFFKFCILGGQTGTGKTELLLELENSIDLEGLANHRGSSFGSYVNDQPTQINFENNLAIELLKKHKQGFSSLLLEDEGFLVGKRLIPSQLFEKMKKMPLVILQVAIEDRVEVTLNDYIISNYNDFTKKHQQQANELFEQDLKASLDRIKKRLGGEKHQQLSALMHESIQAHFDNNDLQGYRELIKVLMQQYYDPMYQYQLNKKMDRVVFQGDREEVKNWLKS